MAAGWLAGNVYRYTYNAAGDQVTLQTPVSALTSTYGHDARHLLTSELEPRGEGIGDCAQDFVSEAEADGPAVEKATGSWD